MTNSQCFLLPAPLLLRNSRPSRLLPETTRVLGVEMEGRREEDRQVELGLQQLDPLHFRAFLGAAAAFHSRHAQRVRSASGWRAAMQLMQRT